MNRTSAETKLERIDELKKEQEELIIKLKKSLAIQELWPGCFELGQVSSYWYGNIYKGMTFVVKVTAPDGSIKEAEFPESALNEALLATMPVSAQLHRAERDRKQKFMRKLNGEVSRP